MEFSWDLEPLEGYRRLIAAQILDCSNGIVSVDIKGKGPGALTPGIASP